MCIKIAGKTFSSDLRKPCLKTGESLSPPTKLILFKRKSPSTKMRYLLNTGCMRYNPVSPSDPKCPQAGNYMVTCGDAARLVCYLGLDTQVRDILNKLETQFRQVASSDVLFQAFYQMAHNKNEWVQNFAAHLEGSLN